jgi:hypothetical protein
MSAVVLKEILRSQYRCRVIETSSKVQVLVDVIVLEDERVITSGDTWLFCTHLLSSSCNMRSWCL